MLYETYIAKSRYARYIDSQKRRENWGETVERYINFMTTHLKTKHDYTITPELAKELQSAIENFEVMPSMRSLMTAGKALQRDNTAGYNCSYLPIDDPKAFDEGMYILLCFAPETLVMTKAGPKEIAKLTTADEVLSYSESNNGFTFVNPSAIFETETDKSQKLELTFEDGTTVKVTDNHLFLTSNRGWIEAKDLTENDDIVNYNSTPLP